MSFPPLPTDNLYKFMAIAGLLLFLLSFYFPLKIAEELELKRIKLDGEIKVFMINVEGREAEAMSIRKDGFEEFRKKHGDSLLAELKKIEETHDISALTDFIKQLPIVPQESLYEAGVLDSTATLDRIERNLLLLKKLHRDRIAVNKLKTKHEELRAITYYRNRWRTLATTGGICGIFLGFVGFGLWYIKLQRPQDQLIKQRLGYESTKQQQKNADKKGTAKPQNQNPT